MEFFTNLPTTKSGYYCITTIVDGVSKRIHIVASIGSKTDSDLAICFFDKIFRLHDIPESIDSDRNPTFTSKLCTHLMNRWEIKLKTATSRHPQTGGSTKIVNKIVRNHLRCYHAFRQNTWNQLLMSVESSYNFAEVQKMKITLSEPTTVGIPSPSRCNNSHNRRCCPIVQWFQNEIRRIVRKCHLFTSTHAITTSRI